MKQLAIGVLDSGIGGFSVVKELKRLLPKENKETYQVAKEYLKPIKDAKVDTLILGCTHYPFLQKVISDIMGPEVKLVNPAYNAVLDLKKILEEKKLLKIDKDKKENYYTTGNPDNMKKVARAIFNSFKYSVKKVNF